MASATVGPPTDVPWLVFCSPPYAFFVERLDDMLDLAGRIAGHGPEGSILVVEADERLDFNRFTAESPDAWDVRSYPPAVIGIWRKRSN
jgi:16S rRNA (guanine966-N2)-methyltransferase